ncbi:MAG: heme ABC transporter ATP-binding protein [Thermomicrobiales bacterium]|nr:heme ABC transporter ATP-binding protein [Thermomicrobiales bacterium]MCO5220364.1 heme ABC transporter ATP-binding protein [Thermomicrobiales bacterium]
MTAAIAAHGVTVIRGERALVRDISIEVEWGEVVALVGPNGAGKSTLLGCIAGDIVPDRGQILLDGQPLERVSLRQRAKQRAVLPQQTVLQFGFSARAVVAMGRSPLPPASREDDARAVTQSLERTEMYPMAHRPFPQLSGGEQHRVSIARILAQEAPILLLDEPTAALDIRHQHLVMETARQTAEAGGAVLAILHDLNLAMAYADQIGVLSQGELVIFDEPGRVADAGLLSDVFAFPLRIEYAAGRVLVVPDVHAAIAPVA